jgi:hypothetical protein
MSEAKVTIGDWECVDTQDTLGRPLRIATRRGKYTKYYAQIESSGRFTGNGGDIGIPADVVAWLASKEAPGPAWVDCRERLPEDEAIVLVFGHYDGMNSSWDFQAVCRFEESSGLWRGIPTDTASDEVTHWMPLPPRPSKPEGSKP